MTRTDYNRYKDSNERPRGILRRSTDGRLAPATPLPLVNDQPELSLPLRPVLRPITQTFPPAPVPPPQPAPKVEALKHVEVSINLPKLHLKKSRTTKKAMALGFSVLLVGVVGGAGYTYWRGHQTPKKVALSAAAVQAAETQTPDFSTVLPDGKTIDKLGGWGRVSPPESAPAFAFSDMIAGVHVVVSEQQLPDNFKPNVVAQVAQFAKQMDATGGGTVGNSVFYVSTAKNGAQSIVFTEKDLLILVRSASQLANQQWADYLGSLH